MSQPEISPLARRLAEENNVDWRGLHGSGAGGKVVERDVLEFLARVMAGEEDVDPTPEPVPDGMEAWPEADVRTFQQEVQASRKEAGLDEIQQELSAADRLGGGALIEGPGAADGGGLAPEAEEISEDIFLFGDDGATGAGADDPSAPPFDAPERRGFGGAVADEGMDDELLVAGEDDQADEVLGGEATEAVGPAAEADPFAGAGSADAGGPDAAPVDLPDVFGDSESDASWQRSADAELFEEEASGSDALEMPPLGDAGATPSDAVGEGADAEEAWRADAPDGGRWASEGAADRAADDAAVWDVEAGPEEPAAPADQGMASGGETAFEEAPPPSSPAAGAPAAGDEVVAFGEGASAAETDLMGEPAAEAAPSATPGALPLVSHGSLLRRHVDVTALAGAQLAVGLELGQGEPLSPAPFLLRAAAKAVADGGWDDASVAMVTFDSAGDVQLRRIDDAARRPFPDLVAALSAGGGEGAAALNVVDMSALDVDEAVLDVEGPQLTLGRILYDNQRGSYRSTLSLAGDVPAERGARLLSRVAELLDAPVRLML